MNPDLSTLFLTFLIVFYFFATGGINAAIILSSFNPRGLLIRSQMRRPSALSAKAASARPTSAPFQSHVIRRSLYGLSHNSCKAKKRSLSPAL